MTPPRLAEAVEMVDEEVVEVAVEEGVGLVENT